MQRIKFDVFNEKLSKATEVEDKLNMIKNDYPNYYAYFLEQCDMKAELKEFEDECRQLKDCPATQFSKYLHGYLLPTLVKQSYAGLLKKGKQLHIPNQLIACSH